MGVAIRRAGAGDRDALARLLDEGFHHDPVSSWIFPDLEHRRSRHGVLMGAFLDSALDEGYVDMAEDGSAVALWMSVPAGKHDESHETGVAAIGVSEGEGGGEGEGADDGAEPDEAQSVRAAVDPGNERVEQIVRLLGAAHPADRPHEYLMLITVSSDVRSQGVGAALIGSVLERCDREGLHAYLEASSERSSHLYERLGFAFTGSTIDLPDGPRMWPMWREPRPLTAG
ncbi:GNAT family N-acetyltransferase [Streptomyces sp. V4-01]|uniref:GNAT family N-acetyltransferase n=1 Tax=Actinacidiphila polyblastidii TaxID=3110430 RepID=A0ABU7PFS1_9ACTN|nr:GNAT family N-acetyltransferase [Streptomyces sp. V4-01]